MDPREVTEASASTHKQSPEMRILHPIFHIVEVIGLVIIAIVTILAGIQEVMAMVERASVHLSDLLMLFIYLEVLSMVIIYLESGRLPIRIPIYIAIVALARYMIIDMKDMSEMKILGISSAIVVLALAVLIIRYGHTKYPYATGDGSRSPRQYNQNNSTKESK
jgi:protein PsiE